MFALTFFDFQKYHSIWNLVIFDVFLLGLAVPGLEITILDDFAAWPDYSKLIQTHEKVIWSILQPGQISRQSSTNMKT